MSLVNKLRKLIGRGYLTSDEYVGKLRDKGIIIGDNCYFYDPSKTNIDTQNPGMIRIGNNVRVTEGVQILTHDYSFSVLCSVCGDIVGSVEPVKIGNNIFIGRNAMILKGVTIGDNIVIQIQFMQELLLAKFAQLKKCTRKENKNRLRMQKQLLLPITRRLGAYQMPMFCANINYYLPLGKSYLNQLRH